MASFKIFGVNEWSARLGPALCGLLTIAAVWYVGALSSALRLKREDFSFWAR